MAKKNKTIAGYHILMLLSAVDGRFYADEDLVIRDFLIDEFPDPIPMNLDSEMDTISSLGKDEYDAHYLQMLKDFYEESTPDERLNLLDFAVTLIKADGEIHESENKYIRKLIETWNLAKDTNT